jgi:purine-nucleoside phosphorylase
MNPASATFPNQPAKYLGTPLIRPENVVRHLLDTPDLIVPQGVIIGYSNRLHPLLEARGFHNVHGYSSPWRSMWLPKGSDQPAVGVVEGFGFGAPGAAIVIEELVALGARRFINLGLAGALPSDVDFGDVVLCTSAIRDEGVSHHYAPSTRHTYPSKNLTDELRQSLLNRGIAFSEGMTWTLDAIYQETLEEALTYRDEGVITVEMEAAALFTIAEVRGVEIASLFTISDHLLSASEWRPAPDKNLLIHGLARGLDASLGVLSPGQSFEAAPALDGDVDAKGHFG